MSTSRSLRWWAIVVVACATVAARAQGPATTPETPPPRSPVLRPAPPGASPALKPKPTATLFDPRVNAKEAIDAAVTRGAPERKRVLVLWGFNASRWALKMQEHLAVPDTARMIRNDYELVAAEVGEGGFGAINMALARSYGADIKIEKNMLPYLTVIETVGDKAGQAILSRSTQGLEKPRSTRENGDYHALRIQDLLVANRAPQPAAADVVNAALATAKQSSRPVLLYFHDAEDPWCVRFKTWMGRADIVELLKGHFVPTTVEMVRFPGAAGEFTRFGGDQGEASPWYVLLDGDGHRLAPDRERGETDFGYPTGDEVQPFVAMLKRVAPGLSQAECGTLAKSLAEVIAPPSPVTKKD
jgi:hypothetical protein